jgi:type I restriction-modification system DNA methylase subunit
MSYKTNTGFIITDNDIKELLRDWDTNIQIGEHYSPLTIARFIIQILNNTTTVLKTRIKVL